MRKIIVTLAAICAIIILCTVTVSAATITVVMGGSLVPGGTAYVSESSFEYDDTIMEAYLENGATYQWYLDGSPISGGTGSSIWIPDSYGGSYLNVVVTIAGGHSGNSGAYYITPVHSCDFSGEWLMDSQMHWHECSCGALADDESHYYGDSWAFSPSEHWRVCSVCGYVEEGDPHIMSQWHIEVEPTFTTEGVIRYTCHLCGYHEDESMPVVPHDEHEFSIIYYDDAVMHWKECACGERTAEGYHTFGPWAVTQEASPTQKGIRSHVCSVCGLNMIEYFDYVPEEDAEEEAEEEAAEEEGSDQKGGKGKKDDATAAEEDSDQKGGKRKTDQKQPEAQQDEAQAGPDAPAGEETDSTAASEKPKLTLGGNETPWGLIGGIAAAAAAVTAAVLTVILRRKKK